ncbi:MAG TPA: helicase-related protein, partial [Methanocorpusculum sp.]|nr:helicase-related protein [Methanocorpusculum sp.]
KIRPIAGQTDDIIREIHAVINRGYRALLTTLTKKLAEELTEFLEQHGIKARYLHSEIQALERIELIRQLRLGLFDVLVGINLLREGLDIPEIGFIGILDADKEGFLRDSRSLIQIIGRAARNADSCVVLYADNFTESMRVAMFETSRRREIQLAFNAKHGIIPKTITKPIRKKEVEIKDIKHLQKSTLPNLIIELETEMKAAASSLDFERAIEIRDMIKGLRDVS